MTPNCISECSKTVGEVGNASMPVRLAVAHAIRLYIMTVAHIYYSSHDIIGRFHGVQSGQLHREKLPTIPSLSNC